MRTHIGALTGAAIALAVSFVPASARPRASQTISPQQVMRSAIEHGVPWRLAVGVIRIESGFRCNARSRDGKSVGVGQVLPRTARSMGVYGSQLNCTNSLEAMMRYLRAAVAAYGPGCAAASAYNRGIGRRSRAMACTAYGRKVLRASYSFRG